MYHFQYISDPDIFFFNSFQKLVYFFRIFSRSAFTKKNSYYKSKRNLENLNQTKHSRNWLHPSSNSSTSWRENSLNSVETSQKRKSNSRTSTAPWSGTKKTRKSWVHGWKRKKKNLPRSKSITNRTPTWKQCILLISVR